MAEIWDFQGREQESSTPSLEPFWPKLAQFETYLIKNRISLRARYHLKRSLRPNNRFQSNLHKP